MSEQDALVSVQNGADSARAVQQQQQGPGIAYTHSECFTQLSAVTTRARPSQRQLQTDPIYDNWHDR
jgi:hypothetical protein